jgi:hypothetical protein
MRTLSRCLVLACVCALGAIAQVYDTFTVSYSVSLSGATTALAIQLPSTGTHRTDVVGAAIQCTAACPVRFEVNGDAATAINSTAATITSFNPDSTPTAIVTSPNFTAWHGTGVPNGTAVSPTWTVPAGALVPFDTDRMLVTRAGTNVNYIMRIPTNHTGTVTMHFKVRSRR